MLFKSGDLQIRRIADSDRLAVLEVYMQCEDFLSLGPVPAASMQMVEADIALSAAQNGIYCLIEADGRALGVLDFIPELKKGVACLSLLMISRPHRHRGIGTAVLRSLEAYLATNHDTTTLVSGVQVNNEAGIRFWKNRGFRIGSKAIPHDDGTVAFDMDKSISVLSGVHNDADHSTDAID